MSIAAGARLGPYEILSPLGAGGMGEVYRAKDTRLERTVAVKVLPAHLAASAESRQRFEREAKTISQLSHPHICALYDVGNQDGVEFLVMEYLEGETLSERLLKGPLAFEQVLRYGIEIADALDKAHRQGIVHRDLKPGNVMLTKSGVKLLDFGLAKAVAPTTPQQMTSFPTQQALTQEGRILGTFQYMAPEQLEGREADARTDIFAFGTVLYEMATGKKAFSGKSQASLISSIMGSQPPAISTIVPMTPPAFDRVVRTCLAKDPDDRWQTAHDVMLELKWVAEGGSAVGLPAPVLAKRTSREWTAWAFAAVGILAALGLWLFRPHGVRKAEAVTASLLPPPGATLVRSAGPLALSPDGRRLVFVARREGKTMLWVRPLDADAAQVLPGTEGATFPFWSPDGRSLAFFAEGRLKRIEAAGGTPETLSDAVGLGGTWNRDGVILFGPGDGRPIHRIPASGGSSAAVTRLGAGETHAHPFFLPDGRHFLYAVGTGASAPFLESIFVASLDGGEPKRLVASNSNAVYADPGYVFFWRERALRAAAFDPTRLRLTSEPFVVASDVMVSPGQATAAFAVSSRGVLVYQRGGTVADLSELLWFDRSGKALGSLGPPAFYYHPRISHDGRRVAVDKSDLLNKGDIWVYEVSGGAATRVSFDPADESAPLWSPDDARLIYFSLKSGTQDIYGKPIEGSASAQPILVSRAEKHPADWSADGRFLLFSSSDPDARMQRDLWVFSFADVKARPFVTSPSRDEDGQFSPNGRWVAYISDESGRSEVYVRPFPGPGPRRQVSTAGGSMPRWRSDGRELFYVALDNKLMAAPVKTGDVFEANASMPLFETHIRTEPTWTQYDVSADGQRFLINTMVETAAEREPITLVLDWTATFER
jgi:Tol biopolymer transport system component/predicted Ser/Thr protein kinase